MTDIIRSGFAGGQLSFRELVERPTFVVNDPQLEKTKRRLIGVPFVITRVTYRLGESSPDYISCECMIADEDTCKDAIERGWPPNVASMDQFPFKPEELVVFNDSSTGVKRSVTGMLHSAGMIDIGNVTEAADFDRPWFEWQSFSQVGQANGEDGNKIDVPDFTVSPHGGPFAIVARHGLRLSEFKGEVDGKKVAADIFYLS